jgi:glycosyltransferase involved in cell wall biosynthesis
MPLLYRSHRVITVSESSKKEIIALGLGDEESIQVINPGITQDLFKVTSKTKHPSLVYVGRLKEYKNIPVAIEAFAEVLKSIPTATFKIAGAGDSWSDLKMKIEELGLEQQVKLISKPSHEEKAKLFAESWLAVQPSMIEGWGITVIEANAAGTPVVAFTVKGLKDSIRDDVTGKLVKMQNSHALAKEIIKLLNDKPTLKKMSKAAKSWSSKFTWEHNVSMLLGIFAQATHTSLHSLPTKRNVRKAHVFVEPYKNS